MSLKTSGFVVTTNEVIIALVQPTGTDLNSFRDRLKESALKLSTELEFINLTDFSSVLDFSANNMQQIQNEIDVHEKKENERSAGFKNLSKKNACRYIFKEEI